MTATFHLVAVAFVRGAGGTVRVLLAVDRDGEQLFDGEPALLFEHRPGRDPCELTLDAADLIPPAIVDLLQASLTTDLAQLVEDSLDAFGQLDGGLLLGRSATLVAPADTFDV